MLQWEALKVREGVPWLSRNKIGSVDTTPNKVECVWRKMGKQENVRDDKRETNIQLVCNMNVMSAHGVQDNGEGYNEMLNWLSARDEMRIEGWSMTCYFKTIVLLQVHGHTNIQKYSEIEIWKIGTKM